MDYSLARKIFMKTKLHHSGYKIWLLSTAIVTLSGIFVFISRIADSNTLRAIALEQTQNCRSDAERIVALNEWVYQNKGFAKCRSYFLLPLLGATPIQVLHEGGDCADKSRLLSAMLAQLHIPSTLAMLYKCEECPPGHTIVEAKYEDGWMVVDPVYNITFPNGKGGFCGIKELETNPQFLIERIGDLRILRGPTDKINYYDSAKNHYRYARAINWKKNALIRASAFFISFFGGDPFLMRRPHFLEDPKLFIALACFVCTVLLVLLRLTTRYFEKRV